MNLRHSWEVDQQYFLQIVIHLPASVCTGMVSHDLRFQNACTCAFVTYACVLSHFSLGPTLCDSMDCSPPRLPCPWDSPGKNTGVGCHAFLQGIFLIQGSNPYLLYLPALAGRLFTTITTWEAPLERKWKNEWLSPEMTETWSYSCLHQSHIFFHPYPLVYSHCTLNNTETPCQGE